MGYSLLVVRMLLFSRSVPSGARPSDCVGVLRPAMNLFRFPGEMQLSGFAVLVCRGRIRRVGPVMGDLYLLFVYTTIQRAVLHTFSKRDIENGAKQRRKFASLRCREA
jgi:hypothetical protein